MNRDPINPSACTKCFLSEEGIDTEESGFLEINGRPALDRKSIGAACNEVMPAMFEQLNTTPA
jgi:hypothetical protein